MPWTLGGVPSAESTLWGRAWQGKVMGHAKDKKEVKHAEPKYPVTGANAPPKVSPELDQATFLEAVKTKK